MLRLPRPIRLVRRVRFNSSRGYSVDVQQNFEWSRDGTIRHLGPAIPEVSHKDIGNVVRSRPMGELLPMATALVGQGKMELAEALVVWIRKLHLQEWYRHKDASCANTFLLAYIKRNDIEGARRWREALFDRSHARPDAITYGILFDSFLENGMDEECRELARQMPTDSITIQKIAESAYLSSAKIDRLCTVFVFGQFNPLDPRHAKENPGIDLYTVQERLEKDCYTAATQKLRKELENYIQSTKASKYSTDMKRLMSGWQLLFSKHIRHSLLNSANLHETSSRPINMGSGILFSSILSAIEPEKISLICLQELTKTASYDIGIGGTPLVRISMSIANSLEREVFAQQICKKNFLEHTKLSARHLEKIFRNRGLFEQTMRRQYAALERNVDALRDGWIPKWSPKLKSEIGVYLVALALDALKFTNSNGTSGPAFKHKIAHQQSQTVGIIEVEPELFNLMSIENVAPFVEPWSMPMLVQPKPWITYNSGGYLTHRISCVRFKDDPLHLALVHQADRDGKLEKILCGLDVLGRTSWRINEHILKVALEMWNSGVNVATLEAPFKGGLLEFRNKDTFSNHEEYVKYVREATERKEILSKSHSIMCDTNYKLEIARQFAGLSFYLPHSVDFRGRAYPIPPHLSHMGSDLSRGLMTFAEGRVLGKRGLRWLKIQLANMAGFDKASLDEREAFASEHLEDIFDSADNPLSGRQWWRKADEPWQCLATCIELAAALRSPNPEEFVSHLPCQVDGSCNGLQHYAALGGDVDGAKQVNLSPADRPQDVYAAVARLVALQIDKDAKDPNHIAAKLVGKINRKIVKQTVMTNVYGVTMYGARQQIQDRLKEFNVVDPSNYGEARAYLAQAVFKSLGTLFDNAQRIQTWLTETAQEISRAVPPEVVSHFGIAVEHDESGSLIDPPRRGPGWQQKEDPSDRYPQTSVYWTTPLGFQVLQPYNKMRSVSLRTVLQSINLRLSSKFDPVDIQKQSSAFPPNFVHSLDATHMFMTAISCHLANLTFASVHDCFWTHAATMDEMNVIIRQEFVKLHTQPILANLREEFVARYRNYVVPEGLTKGRGPTGDIRHIQVAKWRPINIAPIPPKGDFDISSVLESDYFFS